jgi:hypothetical protein
LQHGALAMKPPADLIRGYLYSQVSGFVRDAYGDLPPEVFPEAKLKKRYLKGLEDLMKHEFVQSKHQKQIIVLFSHHKAIKHMLRWAGSKEKIGDPDYCTTL